MFHTIFYEPIYNLLVLCLNVVPLHDVGAAIIIVTAIVKGILLPLNISAVRSQHALKKVDAEIKKVRELHKNDPQTSGTKMMEIYKREKINPLSSIFTMLIQIPIILALYFVFRDGLSEDVNSLYSFIKFPETLHTLAFGILDVTKKNILIGIITGVSAYLLARRQAESMVVDTQKNKKKEPSFQESFQESLRVQILYVFPVIILFTASFLPAALGLYWTTSNILGIAQDYYIKSKHLPKTTD
jgi:YidC/Oxa1 family membrane protein insertase